VGLDRPDGFMINGIEAKDKAAAGRHTVKL
jgi:hypothetical protein